MIKHILFSLFFFSILTGSIPAQISFSVSTDYVLIKKPASNFVMYNYVELENHTQDSLHLRWKKISEEATFSGDPGPFGLGVWEYAIQDPQNYYATGMDLDSADFILPPGIVSTNKFIPQLFPNLQAGSLQLTFIFFEPGNPDEAIEVLFDFNVTELITSTIDPNFQDEISIFPNPAFDQISVSNASNHEYEASLIDVNGVVFRSFKVGEKSKIHYSINDLPSGVYFLIFSSKEGGIENNVQLRKFD